MRETSFENQQSPTHGFFFRSSPPCKAGSPLKRGSYGEPVSCLEASLATLLRSQLFHRRGVFYRPVAIPIHTTDCTVDQPGSGDQAAGFYVLGVFVLESALFTATMGGSFGQVAPRLRVVRVSGDPRPPSLLSALLRQVLVALVIPPLVFRPDGRGLHDVATGTATVTLQTQRTLARR